MKTIIITLLLPFLFFSKILAQPAPLPQKIDKYKVIDSVVYIITYKLTFIRDIRTTNSDNEIVVLEIGRNYSKSYSKTLFDADSVAAEWIKNRAKAIPWAKKNVPIADIYKDHKKKNCKVIFRSILSGPVYQYEEKTNLMNWSIQAEKKKFLAYSCQKATTNFRGREYEAWFTTDIPLHEGPWKFAGLPGLILFVNDKQDHYIF
ncbi:MAG: GLPGLI family protein [Tannerellaceae bacterium]|jgi:GLPGLI family protein|nr:GLPGLI family protein [Tannerellaceae bacterium]